MKSRITIELSLFFPGKHTKTSIFNFKDIVNIDEKHLCRNRCCRRAKTNAEPDKIDIINLHLSSGNATLQTSKYYEPFGDLSLNYLRVCQLCQKGIGTMK